MDREMEDVCEKVCVFEDSLEIDFDYEFDVEKFFDFTRPETLEEIEEAEFWFRRSKGYPPSPLLLKLGLETRELENNDTTSFQNGHQHTNLTKLGDCCEASEVSSLDQGKKGQKTLKPTSKCSFQPSLSRSSRLLKPTASHLAKQNQELNVSSARNPGRVQKVGSTLRAPGEITATKRQKLEIGYLRKFSHLKHQTSFSHKQPKKIEVTDAKSSTRPKVTVPKEPELATARRAQTHRSKKTAQLCNSSKINCPNTNVSLPEKSNKVSRSKADQYKKKVLSQKEDISAIQNNKPETPAPRDFKASRDKKASQNLPIELFQKLNINAENQCSSLTEHKQPQIMKGLKNNLQSSIMKENKIPDVATGKPRTCFMQQNRPVGGALSHISKSIQPVPGA